MAIVKVHGTVQQSADVDTVQLLGEDGRVLDQVELAADGSYELTFDAPQSLVEAAAQRRFPGLVKLLSDEARSAAVITALRGRGYTGLVASDDRETLMRALIAAEPQAILRLEQRPDEEFYPARLRFFSRREPERASELYQPILQLDNELHIDLEQCQPYTAPTSFEYASASPWPRLAMLQQHLATPQIGDPDHQTNWRTAFLSRALKDPGIYLGFIVHMLGKERASAMAACTPAEYIALALLAMDDPDYTSAAEVQAAFHDRWKKRFPAESPPWMSRPRDTEALTQRVMDGVCPAYFEREHDSSDHWISFDWPVTAGTAYSTPAVRARFSSGPGDAEHDSTGLALQEIQYRWSSADEWTAVTPAGDDKSDFTAWGHAKCLLRIALLLAGEIDFHIARGHLLAEQYQVALWRALAAKHGNDPARWTDDPIYQLLKPHIYTAADINNYGNPLIFSERSIFPRASGLTHPVYVQAVREQLGTLDWRGFTPRRPACRQHHYAKIGMKYWEVVQEHVRAYLRAHEPKLNEDVWRRFSDELVRHSPPVPAWLPARRERLRASDAAELTRNAPGEPAMSPLRSPEDLVQLCAHAIFHATFVHGWVNDRQIEDGGDVFAASFGLRDTTPPPHDEAAQRAWKERTSPRPQEACFQLFLADSLSLTRYGYFGAYAPAGQPALAELTRRLVERQTEFADLGTPIDKIRALINI